jgi:hypothetical protein
MAVMKTRKLIFKPKIYLYPNIMIKSWFVILYQQ